MVKWGKEEQKQWGEVSEESVWRDLKFPKEANEVLHYSQQKHSNNNEDRQRWWRIQSAGVPEEGLSHLISSHGRSWTQEREHKGLTESQEERLPR